MMLRVKDLKQVRVVSDDNELPASRSSGAASFGSGKMWHESIGPVVLAVGFLVLWLVVLPRFGFRT